jgi:hypothetical protein
MLQTLQNLDRRILYVTLVVLCSLFLFVPGELPVSVEKQTVDLYSKLMTIPTDKPVIIETDWTVSTRGENMGHLESLVRILMARKVKFAFFTATSEAPAVQVSRSVVDRINEERKKAGLYEYKPGEDYISIGLFPNTEGIQVAMGQDLRKAWGDRKVKTANGDKGVFETSVMKNVNSIKDVSLMVIVTASSTVDTAVERLSDKVDLGLMCTGVVGGTSLQYYPAQLKGIANGLKAGYEMEYMMKYGVNVPDAKGVVKVPADRPEQIPAVGEGVAMDRASKYYLTLHVALVVLILAVILGNVTMVMSKRAANGGAK